MKSSHYLGMPLTKEHKVKDLVFNFVLNLVFPSLLLLVLYYFRYPLGRLSREPLAPCVRRCGEVMHAPLPDGIRRIPRGFVSLGWGLPPGSTPPFAPLDGVRGAGAGRWLLLPCWTRSTPSFTASVGTGP